MIKCPNSECGFENVDGTQFCEACGEELPQSGAADAATENLVKCPQCGEMNPADNLACEACGTELQAGSAPSIPSTPTTAEATFAPADGPTLDSAPETTPFDAALSTPVSTPASAPATMIAGEPAAPPPTGDLKPGLLKLVVEQGQTVGAQFVLGDEEMLVGREDEDEEIYPDIDLSDQDAGYVHRQHAKLKFENGNLLVTHLGGANKTRINNKPIPDEEPQNLKLGDKIAFGKVVLRLLPV